MEVKQLLPIAIVVAIGVLAWKYLSSSMVTTPQVQGQEILGYNVTSPQADTQAYQVANEVKLNIIAAKIGLLRDLQDNALANRYLDLAERQQRIDNSNARIAQSIAIGENDDRLMDEVSAIV